MKILIIDNNIDPPYWGSHDLKTAVQQVAPSAQVMVRRGPQQDFNLNFSEFDKLVISGSKTSCLEKAPWITALDEFVLRMIQAKKPLLGVCYGHQTLNRVLGGSSYLKKSEKSEFGWIKIKSFKPNPLFEGLKNEFYSYGSHVEEVSRLPEGMKNFASSERCEIQACQYQELPIFGIQFHPEKTAESAKVSLKSKIQEGEETLLADRTDELYNPEVCKIIFKNFLKHV
jgi:GMP synthase-like glutamine amidotransferase